MNSSFQRLLSEAARLVQSAREQALVTSSADGETLAHPLFELPVDLKNSRGFINTMTPSFQNLMAEATRLTQGGNLQAATAAIQAALSGAAVPAMDDVCDMNVIDVEAIEVGRVTPMPEQPTQPTQPTQPARPAKPGPGGQFISASHTQAAGTRDYKLYIPPESFEEALPLVVMLHGCTQSPDDFAAGTGMNAAALKRGFYVLYPSQTQHANSSRCWNWFKHNHQQRGRGEPALLSGMTRDVMKRYHIDPQRVYVAGLSAGGAMAVILGDAYPELYAAVGVHSGLLSGSATNVQSALSVMQTGTPDKPHLMASPPTIVFHGDKDTTVNPVNGEQVVAASAGAAKAEQKRARSSNGREYTQRIYRDESGRVVAEHWAVHGAGHAWSGGSAQGSYTDGQGPDATQEMLRFFLANTLPTSH